MFTLEAFSPPVRKRVCVRECECVRAHGRSESLTVWPSALRLLSPVGSCLSRSNTHSPQCISSKLTNIDGVSYGNTARFNDVFEGRFQLRNSCSNRKLCWILAVVRETNTPFCANADIYFSGKKAEIIRNKDFLHRGLPWTTFNQSSILIFTRRLHEAQIQFWGW